VHLTRTDTNERVEVEELRGVAAEDLHGALLEMEATASGARTKRPFYHGSINILADERLTREQWRYAVDRLEAELGLSDQARAVVVHVKDGREHRHVVWSRIDLERMTAISDSHNFRKHEIVARELEREWGLERVQGAHIEREGKERPERTPSHAEMLQADRTGLSTRQVKDQVTDIWRRTDNGASFAIALWEGGFALCRGDRRDFVVIDPMGGTHSLARCVEGAKTKDIRARMADLDRSYLPSVAQGKDMQAQRRQERGAEQAHEQPRQAVKDSRSEAPRAGRDQTHERAEGPATLGRAAGGVGRVAGAALDGLASIFERGLSGGGEAQGDQDKETPPPARDEREDQRMESVRDDEAAKTKLSQELFREFGKNMTNEQEAQHQRDQDRDRDRTRR
jgi:hypothetical protein